MKRQLYLPLAAVVAALLVAGSLVSLGGSADTVHGQATVTTTATGTGTATATGTATVTATGTGTGTPTATATGTGTPTATATGTGTATATATGTGTAMATGTPMGTGTITGGTRPPQSGGGFGLFVFGGGTFQQLQDAACPGVITDAYFVTNSAGNFVPFVPASTVTVVNAEFNAMFPGGTIPAGTPLIGKCSN